MAHDTTEAPAAYSRATHEVLNQVPALAGHDVADDPGLLTAVAAQITENTRVVYAIGGLVLGAAFVLRAVGDIGDGTISWLSPIGWAQKTRPFAGDVWWPFLIVIGANETLAIKRLRIRVRDELVNCRQRAE